jgi:hypothetical protein
VDKEEIRARESSSKGEEFDPLFVPFSPVWPLAPCEASWRILTIAQAWGNFSMPFICWCRRHWDLR